MSLVYLSLPTSINYEKDFFLENCVSKPDSSFKLVPLLGKAISYIDLSLYFESISLRFLPPQEGLCFLFQRVKIADHFQVTNLFGLTCGDVAMES